MNESPTTKNYKTPSYIRKASSNYYNKMRDDPEKYTAYLEKRRIYQRKIKEEKDKTKQEDNKDKITEKIICNCGGKYCRQNKTNHLKTKKHNRYLESLK